MILYNVTCNVENGILNEWMKWMQEIHIPEVMKTEMFTDYRIYRILLQEDNNTTTYSVQYFAKNIGMIDKYLQKFAPELKQKHLDKYGTKVMTFRTVMEELS